jgi:hypothetical protein
MKPHVFQSGFVAQRIARGLRDQEPNAVINIVPLKGPGHAKVLPDGSAIWVGTSGGFVIQKVEHEITTLWVSPADGWVPPDAF